MNNDEVCPFLGLENDPDSLQGFPSGINYCHRCLPASPIQLTHQGSFCLSGKYRQCAVFINPQAQNARANVTRAHRRRQSPLSVRMSIVLAIVLVLAVLFGWQLFGQPTTSPLVVATRSAVPTSRATSTPLPTDTAFLPVFFIPSATGTPTLYVPFFGSATVTLTPSLTPSATFVPYLSKHRLDAPIGTEHQFIIHRLSAKERLDPWLQQYNTSIEAVKAINFNLFLTNPVRRDVLVIFPLNFTDVSGLHVLDVYQMPEVTHNINPAGPGARNYRGINYEDLLIYLRQRTGLKINWEDFKYYNGITDPGERPVVGDYFLLPQPQVVP